MFRYGSQFWRQPLIETYQTEIDLRLQQNILYAQVQSKAIDYFILLHIFSLLQTFPITGNVPKILPADSLMSYPGKRLHMLNMG